jgi:WD40 repeat protein
VEAVLQKLAAARLVTTDELPDHARTVTLAHERLISDWPWLKKLVEENRETIALQNQIAQDAQEWKQTGRDVSYLYTGARLATAREQVEARKLVLNELAHAFVQTGIKTEEEQQQRKLQQATNTQRQRALILGIGLVVAIVLSLVALGFYRQADTNLQSANIANTQSAMSAGKAETAAHTAETAAQMAATAQVDAEQQRDRAQRRQLAAQALNIANNRLDLGLLLGVEANRNTDLSDLHGSVLTTLLLEPRLRKYLPGHPRGISSIALSPDGKVLAAGTVDKTIILWDVTSGQPIGQPLTGHDSQVISLAFSPDGRMLVSGSNDPVFRLWDVSNPKLPVQIAALQNESPSGRIIFTSDGRPFSIDSGGSFNESTYLWNTPLSQPLGQDFVACACGALSLAFSRDGKTLALGGGDGHVELWDIPGRQRIKTLRYFTQPQFKQDGGIFSLAFSPDGKWLASGSGMGFIRLWDLTLASDQPTKVRYFVGSSIARVAFSPDSSTLVYSNGTNKIDVWNLASDKSYDVDVAKITSRVLSLTFSPDGKTLALGTSDNSIILWDLASRQQIGQPLNGHDSEVFSVAFSADGKMLVSSDWNHNIILWDLTVNQRLGVSLDSHGYWIPSVAFSPHGKTIASAVEMSSTAATTIILWDMTKNPPLSQTLADGENLLSKITFSPDGKSLAASEQDSIVLWDIESKQPVTRLNSSGEIIVFNPNGQMLAVGNDKTITLWNITTGRSIGTPLSTGGEQVDSIAFSPDGKVLASGIGGQWKPGKIILWDTATGQQIGQPLTGHTDRVSSLTFSPDGKILASGSWDKLIILWDVTTKNPIEPPLKGHTDWVSSIAFNPTDGGLTLASGGMDGTVRLWDVRNHQQVGSSLTKYTGKINSISFNPDGSQQLVTSGEGGVAVVWETNLDQWKMRACSVANRNLSLTEWQEYFPSTVYQKTCLNLPLPPSLVENFLISEQQLIAIGEMSKALTQFQDQFKLDPELKTELEKLARNFPVWNLAKRGSDLAVQGDLTGALQVYQEIQYLGATDKALADLWSGICWYGGIGGHATDQLKQVCEKAVTLAPDNGAVRDSRGLVRALLGDYPGAIEDFKFFIRWAKEGELSDTDISLRETWITELEAGRNPFDEATLESLRNQ